MLLIADMILLVNNISSKRQPKKKDVLSGRIMMPFSKKQKRCENSFSVTISVHLKTKLPTCIFR